MQSRAHWKEFEKLVEKIQRGLHPESEITSNQFLQGNDSGGRRQVDIVIRHRVGTTNLLIIVECKRKGRPVDLKEMEEFIGLKNDVRAHAGIIVSTKGFSKRSIKLARKNNIQTFTIAETERNSWKVTLSASILVEEWVLVPRRFQIFRKDGTTLDILDDRDLELIDSATGKEIVPAALIQKVWMERPDKSVGPFQHSFPIDGDPLIVKFVVVFESELEKSTRRASLHLIGLVDAESGLTYTNRLQFDTESSVKGEGRPVFSAFIRTTTVRTVQRPSSGLNLSSKLISIQFDTKKPQTFNLGKPPE